MRFLLGALLLIGVALFLANPDLFGKKNKFKFSSDGQIRIDQRGASKIELDWEAIGSDLVGLISPEDEEEPAKPTAVGPLSEEIASAEQVPETPQVAPETEATVEPQVLPATQANTPDLNSYEGQLTAIAAAIEGNPAQTEALMQAASRECLGAQAPEPLQNYFVKLVELAALAKGKPAAEQRAFFVSQNNELTTTLKFWLLSQPDTARASANNIMKSWASRPTDLVACHLGWLQSQ